MSRFPRQANLVYEFRSLGIFNPQAQRLANASADLVKCGAVGVAPAHSLDMRDPSPRLISLDDDAIDLATHSAISFQDTVLDPAQWRAAFRAEGPALKLLPGQSASKQPA
jgi:hypothetical protein